MFITMHVYDADFEDEDESDLEGMIEDSFEMTSHPLPPYYRLLGNDGPDTANNEDTHFVVAGDMKRFTQVWPLTQFFLFPS